MSGAPGLEVGRPIRGVIRVGWLYSDGVLTRDMAVRLDRGELVDVLPAVDLETDSEVIAEYPDALLHPGLVNAHAHLDLTGDPVAHRSGAPFTVWLASVRQSRMDRSDHELREAVMRGVAELVRGGVIWVVDFSAGSISEEILAEAGVHAVVLRELIGLTPERSQVVLEEARGWLESPSFPSVQRGLAPHAPYSASSALVRESHELRSGLLGSIHVAEDLDERRFLEEGTGAFCDFLTRLGIAEAAFPKPGKSVIPYLDHLGGLDESTLLVHANDLRSEEIAVIAQRGCPVIFCPGTHRYFDRPTHPLPKLLEAGVPVALGTDSSASNHELSMRGEMRTVRQMFPELSARTVVDLGIAAAFADRLPGGGTLRRAEPANFAVTRVEEADPLESFIQTPGVAELTVARGRLLWRRA